MCVGERETQRQCVGTFVNRGVGKVTEGTEFYEVRVTLCELPDVCVESKLQSS